MCHSAVLLEHLVRDRHAELRRFAAEAHRGAPKGQPTGFTRARSGGDGWPGMPEGRRRRLAVVTRSIVSRLRRVREPRAKFEG